MKRLLASSWPRQVRTAEDAARLGPSLGLQPDLLVEARRLHVEQARENGVQEGKGRKRAGSGHYQVEVCMPEETWARWHEWCEAQGLASAAALRALVHAYLLGAWEPTWRSRYWPGPDGSTVSLHHKAWEREHKAAWPCREKALLTDGARIALRRRANRLNLSLSGLVRGIIVMALEGHVRTVQPIDPRAMPNDPDLYPTPPEPE